MCILSPKKKFYKNLLNSFQDKILVEDMEHEHKEYGHISATDPPPSQKKEKKEEN